MAKDKSHQYDLSGLEVIVDEVTATTVTVDGKALALNDDVKVGAVSVAEVADVDSSHALAVEIDGNTYYIPMSTVATFDTEA